MAKELTLDETMARMPQAGKKFGVWFKKLMKGAKIDEAAFWGDDSVQVIPTGGKTYKVFMSAANLNLVRKQLNKPRQGGLELGLGKEDVFFVNPPGQPILISYEVIGSKPIVQFKLDTTSLKPRGGAGKESKNPDTVQQEKVTLRIFQELLSKKGRQYDKKGFKALMNDHLKKIYPDIDHPERVDWTKHFELQFNEVRDTTKLPNNKFDVFDYDDFMDYIVKIVIGGPPNQNAWPQFGKISQKDSWNPADIWLVQSGSKYEEVKKELRSSGTIKELNDVLRYAYHNHIISGVSLKKSSGKPGGLKWELVNLESKMKNLPEIEMGVFKMDLPMDNGKFVKTTAEISVTNNNQKVGLMRTGSNTTGVGNNTYEFKAAGAATAMLGKVPKDLMLARIQQAGLRINTLPTWQDMENKLPKAKNDGHYLYWKKVVTTVKRAKWVDTGGWNIDQFPDDLLVVGRDAKIAKGTSADMQIVAFAYLLTEVQKKVGLKGLNELIEDLFYFAQKKGAVGKSEFGPISPSWLKYPSTISALVKEMAPR